MTRSGVFDDRLGSELETFIKERLGGEVTSVDFREEMDDEGSAFVIVTVGVVGSAANFVRSKPTGLLRILRRKLIDADVDAFPTLNYVSVPGVIV